MTRTFQRDGEIGGQGTLHIIQRFQSRNYVRVIIHYTPSPTTTVIHA